jgi:hypothetical protein
MQLSMYSKINFNTATDKNTSDNFWRILLYDATKLVDILHTFIAQESVSPLALSRPTLRTLPHAVTGCKSK